MIMAGWPGWSGGSFISNFQQIAYLIIWIEWKRVAYEQL